MQVEDITDGDIKEYSIYHDSGMYRLSVSGSEVYAVEITEGQETPVQNPEFIQALCEATLDYEGKKFW